MEAYSIDLRTRVVTAEGSSKEVAERYNVSVSFVQRMRNLYNRTGGVAIKPKGGKRPPAVDENGGLWLIELIKKENDLTLIELCARYHEQFGVSVSKSAMDRKLHRLKITRKKTKHDPKMYSERVQKLTEIYLSEIATIEDVNSLIFIDESGANQNMILNYGRSLSGQKVYDEQPTARGKRVSTVGALSCQGIKASMCFEGTLTREVFKQFLSQILLPELKEGDVVVMDNASVHHHESIVQLIESKKARVLYLPPYSPQFNPIENAWSKMKHYLRKVRARTIEALYDAWAQAIKSITPQDAKGYFQHAGLC